MRNGLFVLVYFLFEQEFEQLCSTLIINGHGLKSTKPIFDFIGSFKNCLRWAGFGAELQRVRERERRSEASLAQNEAA